MDSYSYMWYNENAEYVCKKTRWIVSLSGVQGKGYQYMKAAIFTLDTKSYRARKASAAGVVLKKMLEQAGFETAAVRVIPKDHKVAASVLKRVAEDHSADLVLTTGGVGYQAGECASDALEEVAERLLPGIPEAMRGCLLSSSKSAMFNRSAAGICKQTMMINLPGDAKEAKDALEYLLPELMQALESLNA